MGKATRLTCAYCHTINQIVMVGDVFVTKKVEPRSARISERPVTVEDVEAEIVDRGRHRPEESGSFGLILGVVAVIAILAAVIAMLTT